jgi:hypothetical protein
LSEQEFTGERRGADGVGRVYWIRNAEGEELTFICDGHSLLISNKGQKVFSEISAKEFVELFKLNEMVTVKYVEKNGKKLVNSIGPAAIAK